MKQIFESWNKFMLNEASLSRLHQHISNHDSAIITAFRADPASSESCVTKSPSADQEKAPLSVNKQRNKDLKAVLLRKGYGVTRVDGSYIENFDDPSARKEVSEESFFVVNLKGTEDFIPTIEKLGRIFCQDSVLIIPQGGRGAYLFGTNDAWPGLGLTEPVGDFTGGKEAEFMSRIRKRPFIFKEVGENTETYNDLSRNSKWAVAKIAERILSEE